MSAIRGTKYRITGNTYRNRHVIKQLGGEWHPAEKAWTVRVGGNGWPDTMWSLRRSGCKVEPID